MEIILFPFIDTKYVYAQHMTKDKIDISGSSNAVLTDPI